MKRILIAAVLVGALVQAGAASAGCMATVGLAPPPAGIQPGTTWSAELTVLQHGVRPLPNAKTARPTVTIVNTETGAQKTFVARGTKDPAVFVANVVFPTAGSWRYEVYDGFSTQGGQPVPCAQTHTFEAVGVGGVAASGGEPPAPTADPSPAVAQTGNDSSFPLWPVVGGTLAALAALAVSVALLRRRRAQHGSEVVAH
ncbi:MAG: hypothetical protein ACRDNG_07190 [Gaiellaceae bacterium]